MQLGSKSKNLPINKSIKQDREYTHVFIRTVNTTTKITTILIEGTKAEYL